MTTAPVKTILGIKITYERLLFTFMGVLMISGIVAVVAVGLKPRAIPVIKLSEFANENTVANSINMGVPEFKEEPLLIVGVEPGTDYYSRLLTAWLPSQMFQHVIVDEDLNFPADFQRTETISFKNNMESIFNQLRERVNRKERTLLITAHVNATQVIARSFTHLMNEAFRQVVADVPVEGASQEPPHFVSLVFSDFTRRREDEKNFKIPCATVEDKDQFGVGALGCQILQQSRLYYRKKMTPGHRVGLMSQIGRWEYLFLMTEEP